jgi:hypothetical protein
LSVESYPWSELKDFVKVKGTPEAGLLTGALSIVEVNKLGKVAAR